LGQGKKEGVKKQKGILPVYKVRIKNDIMGQTRRDPQKWQKRGLGGRAIGKEITGKKKTTSKVRKLVRAPGADNGSPHQKKKKKKNKKKRTAPGQKRKKGERTGKGGGQAACGRRHAKEGVIRRHGKHNY